MALGGLHVLGCAVCAKGREGKVKERVNIDARNRLEFIVEAMFVLRAEELQITCTAGGGRYLAVAKI